VGLGRFLIRGGRFIQSLAVSLLKPDDLVGLSQQTYAGGESVDNWNYPEIVDSGLGPVEKVLLEKVPLKKGRVLDLGMGGGREAIALSRLGYEVTGVDFVPEMAKKAEENAKKRGIKISCIAGQDISKLQVPDNYYDIVWFSEAMYSAVPTRKRRVEMLKRLQKTLKPGGYCVCQFTTNTGYTFSPTAVLLRKIAAFLTLGNFGYEKGDLIWGNNEFAHAFLSENDTIPEFEEAGGFEVVSVHSDKANNSLRAGAVLKKKA
jgi:ubiquinone/menaquinone biosynthesis C-methylase UbiE